MNKFVLGVLTRSSFFVLISSLFVLSGKSACAENLVSPSFSHESGFYSEEFELFVSHPDSDVKIYYTIDGSDPDPNNLEGTTYRYKNEYAQPPATEPKGEFLTQEYKTYIYIQPIIIKDQTYEPDRVSQISTTFDEKPEYIPRPDIKLKDSWRNKTLIIMNSIISRINNLLNKLVRHYNKYILNIENAKTRTKKYLGFFDLKYEEVVNPKYSNKGVVIKAIAINKKKATSDIINKIFFIGNNSEFKLPIMNITVPDQEIFSYGKGILVAGASYDNWLKAGDFENVEDKPWRWPANWIAKTRIPAYLTILDPRANKLSESFIDFRVHGNTSRQFALKSLRIYPNKSKSLKGIELDFFRDGKVIGLDRINLRNSGSNWRSNYPTDAAIHKIMKGLNFATQRYQPVSIYINGEYYGLLNARGRKDHYYISSLYELPSKKIDLLKGRNEPQKGDAKNWESFLEFIDSYKNRNNDEFYSEVYKYISIDSFIDYYISELFIANVDWPDNNIAYWRYKGSEKQPVTSQGFTDGRWRWIMYDTDAAGNWAKKPELDMLSYATAVGSTGRNPDWSTLLLRTLLENKKIEEKFIIRFADLLNTHFLPDRAVSVLKSIRESVIDEIPMHIRRWSHRPKNLKDWEANIVILTSFFEQRPKYQWQHLQEFFKLDGLYSLNIDITQPAAGKIKVNTLTVGDDPKQNYNVTDTPLFFPWNGQYFKNLPLILEVFPKEGYIFSHWDIPGQKLEAEEKQQLKLVLKPQNDLIVKAIMIKLD